MTQDLSCLGTSKYVISPSFLLHSRNIDVFPTKHYAFNDSLPPIADRLGLLRQITHLPILFYAFMVEGGLITLLYRILRAISSLQDNPCWMLLSLVQNGTYYPINNPCESKLHNGRYSLVPM